VNSGLKLPGDRFGGLDTTPREMRAEGIGVGGDGAVIGRPTSGVTVTDGPEEAAAEAVAEEDEAEEDEEERSTPEEFVCGVVKSAAAKAEDRVCCCEFSVAVCGVSGSLATRSASSPGLPWNGFSFCK
jgi:hypothetical protein